MKGSRTRDYVGNHGSTTKWRTPRHLVTRVDENGHDIKTEFYRWPPVHRGHGGGDFDIYTPQRYEHQGKTPLDKLGYCSGGPPLRRRTMVTCVTSRSDVTDRTQSRGLWD